MAIPSEFSLLLSSTKAIYILNRLCSLYVIITNVDEFYVNFYVGTNVRATDCIRKNLNKNDVNKPRVIL